MQQPGEEEERHDWPNSFVVVVLNAHDRLTCAPTCGRKLFLSFQWATPGLHATPVYIHIHTYGTEHLIRGILLIKTHTDSDL